MLPTAPPPPNWRTPLSILGEAGAVINRLGPDTTLREALELIVQTAVRLIGADPADGARAVIYTYAADPGAFDPGSRVSAGEGEQPLTGDTPRVNGVGALALTRRARVLSYEETGIAFHPLKYQAGIRTAACYPLIVAGQPVAALYIDLSSQRRFTDDELLWLDTLVQLGAVAIYNTRQFEGLTRALQRRVVEFERLQNAGRLISSRLNLDDTLQQILNSALDMIGAEHGSFRLLDKHTGRLRQRAIAGRDAEPLDPNDASGDLEIDEHSSVVGWVAQHGQPACIADLHEPPWAEIYRPLYRKHEMRSELAIPLLGSGRGLEGVLNLESPRLSAFDANAQRVLEALATQAVIAIQEAKLLDALEEATAQLATRTPDELFGFLIAHACDLLNVPDGAVWVCETGDLQKLTLRASTSRLPAGYQIGLDDTLHGLAIHSRRSIVSADFNHDPRTKHRTLVNQMGWVASLIVPLVSRDQTPRGAFGVYTIEPRAFSDWDTRLLTSLANHAAVALQQAEALTQLQEARERQAVAETFAALGDIAANILHRVNNLVGIIPVHVQGLADKRPTLLADTYVATTLREIEDSARAAMSAARETMAYLRPLRLQSTAVAACYRTAITRINWPAHIQLTEAGLADLPNVLAGEEQLRLVFFNLIENALDALGEQPGRVDVRGRVIAATQPHPRPWVEITVADTGPGIPAAQREKIFDPEFSTKRSARKLGFGLWWVKSLVQRFGGSIALANTDCAGCTFTLCLPCA